MFRQLDGNPPDRCNSIGEFTGQALGKLTAIGNACCIDTIRIDIECFDELLDQR
jgi:hypothetical protein